MRKHRILLIAVCSLVALGVIVATTPRDEGPTYQGRSLNYWLEVHDQRGTTNATPDQVRQAEEAVRHIGTNALPYLLKWMTYEPHPWQNRLAHLIYRLPEPAGSSALLNSTIYNDAQLTRSMLAGNGFQILGEQAAPAVPELTILLNNTNSLDLRRRAAHALAFIGRSGLPALLQALSSTNYPKRSTVASAIFLMSGLGTNASPAVPVLIRCTQDTDPALAAMAVQALGHLRIAPEIVVPALTNAFRAADKDVRFWAVRSFVLWPTAEAYRAAPALQSMLNDSDYRIREDASNILAQIASEVLTNAPAR